MQPGRKGTRAGVWLRQAALSVALALPCFGQEAPAPLLTLDQDRFFLESAFGRAALDRERAATAELEQENKRIETELVAEEQALTALRKTLPAEEFTSRADAFDEKVERIRTEQDAKARRLTEGRDKDRKDFLKVAIPILGEILGEKGAVAIIEKGTVIISLSAIDVTDEAIAKVDAALAEPAPVQP